MKLDYYMKLRKMLTADPDFNLVEVHSFVSDSTDSCQSGKFSNRSASASEGLQAILNIIYD